MSTYFQSLINSQRSTNKKKKNLFFSPQKLKTNTGSPQKKTRSKKKKKNKANYFYFESFLVYGNLRSYNASPYKRLNVADVNNI